MAGRSKLLLVFGLASLAAVGLGAWVCAASGVPAASWIRNLAAWSVGVLLAAGLAYAGGRRPLLVLMLAAAPLGLALTFLNADQQGVHRWINAGPLHVNMAMLLLPAAIVALAGLAREWAWPWLAAVLAIGLLVLQPDASQALALAVAASVAAAILVRGPPLRLALFAGLAGLAVVAWLRADPLQPVAEVEGLVGLAFRISPVAGVGVLGLLAAIAAAPMLSVREASLRAASWGLGSCFLVWAAAPFLGAFPVPFAGIGMSPIVGAWLGVGLLAGLSGERRRAPADPPVPAT